MAAIRAHLLVCGLVAVYLENEKLFFKPMVEDAFDYRLRGSFGTPLCVKLMMNCWEVATGGYVCNEQRLLFASACTNMRNMRCMDQWPWGQFGYTYEWMQIRDTVCASGEGREVAAGDS